MFKGRLRIRATGARPEKLLNAALERGLELAEVRMVGGGLEGWLSLGDFRELPPLAKEAGCRIRVLEREGLPFRWRGIKRRPVLLAGFLLLGICFYLVTTRVWFIQVDGAGAMSQRVLVAAAKAGLYPGVPQGEVDPRKVEGAVLKAVPGLGWAGILKEGSLLRMRVVPAKYPFSNLAYPADLVASKAATIKGMEVYAGVPQVVPGETVQQGQVLIRGDLGPGPSGEPIVVKAQGTVTAVLEYLGRGEVPLRDRITVPGSGRYLRLVIKLGALEKIIWGGIGPPFPSYPPIRTVWRIPGLAVELMILKYQEGRSKVITLSSAGALQEAKGKATAALKKKIPPGGKIRSLRFVILPGKAQTVAVEVMAMVQEDIGLARPISEGRAALGN